MPLAILKPEIVIRRIRLVLSCMGLSVLMNAGTPITAVAQPAALFWQQSEGYVAEPSTNGVCTDFIGYPVKQLSPSVREFEVRQHCATALGVLGEPSMSSVWIVRVDCPAKRYALVKSAGFSGPFWSGRIVYLREPKGFTWDVAIKHAPYLPDAACL
jgi:hypothetical protein